MAKSKIEWTDETWNPITGCEPVSEGCDNCYAQRMAKRLKAMGQEKYQNGPDGFEPTFHQKELDRPLSWKKPKRVFVCSMSDIAWAKPIQLARIYACMAMLPHITFQILTKRPQWILDRLDCVKNEYKTMAEALRPEVQLLRERNLIRPWHTTDFDWPPKNVWVGVTVENQQRADERIPKLLQIPAAVRFVSCEPLLGPVNLKPCAHEDCNKIDLDWVIAGGESGPGARPTHPDWVRSLRDQAQAADVPFMFKQWGAWAPEWVLKNGEPNRHEFEDGTYMWRRGKKAAGRRLDGETWDQFPEGVSEQCK